MPVVLSTFLPLSSVPGFATARTLGLSLALTAFPHGGQQTARRNAWRAMVDDAALSRARAEAEQAVEEARIRTAAAPRTRAAGR